MITKFSLFESKGEPIEREKALMVCEDLSEKLNLKLVNEIGPDTEGEPNCAYIGGSLRRGEKIVNDIQGHRQRRVPGSSETERGLYQSIKYGKYPDGKPWKDPKRRGKK